MNKKNNVLWFSHRKFLNEKVTLKGWVHNRRDLGGLILLI